MQRSCDSCGVTYEAKRSTSRYCSGRCRTRACRAPEPRESTSVVPLVKPPEHAGLVDVTRRELQAAGRADTVAGAAALLLAERLEFGPSDTGASVASMVKQLHATMAEALAGTAAAVDPVDELRARRDRKRAAR